GANRGTKAITPLARTRERPSTRAGFVFIAILSAAEQERSIGRAPPAWMGRLPQRWPTSCCGIIGQAHAAVNEKARAERRADAKMRRSAPTVAEPQGGGNPAQKDGRRAQPDHGVPDAASAGQEQPGGAEKPPEGPQRPKGQRPEPVRRVCFRGQLSR